MGTARDFHVKTGLTVDSGNVTLTNGNVVVNNGHIDIDNIKIDGQTISTVANDDDISITPHGNGEVNISKVDIDSGTIDGATIATSDITVGTSKTLDVSGGTLTLADDQISGDAIDGGTIGSITITELGGHLSLGDNNITNVGDIDADSISVDEAGNGLNIDFSGANTGTSKLTLGDNLADALNITEGSNSYMKFTTTNGSEQIVFAKDSTFNGTTIADLGTVSTADIDGGTIDGATIGGTTAAAITGTTIDATTDFTVGSTVITDDSIVMTPSTNDTITIAGAANGALGITTVDNAANAAHITATADGDITLNTKNVSNSGNDAKIAFQYNDADRVRVRSGATAGAPYLEVLGNVDITGSIQGGTTASPSAGVTNIRGSGFIHSGSARMRQSTGTLNNVNCENTQAGTHHIIDIDNTNFYSSDTVTVSETQGRSKTPGTTFGSHEDNVGNVMVFGVNIYDSSKNVFQAVEAFASMSIANDSGEIQKRVVNKLIGYVQPSQGTADIVESHMMHESGDTELGYFHFVYFDDGAGTGADTMVLVFKWTSPYEHTTNDETTYSFNVNGLSLSGSGG